jgi:hypothetical protein
LLKELRFVEVLHSTEFAATVVSWQSSLAAAPGKESVTLNGAHYYGLGMRFLESMDKGGEFLNGGTDAVEVVRGDERNFRSTWCAYTANADGKPVTVAMFDRPDNPRHPATWFIMTTPFAYLSATLNVRKQPLEVTEDNPLVVRYGIALWDGRVEVTQIERACRWWVNWSSPDTAGPPQADEGGKHGEKRTTKSR